MSAGYLPVGDPYNVAGPGVAPPGAPIQPYPDPNGLLPPTEEPPMGEMASGAGPPPSAVAPVGTPPWSGMAPQGPDVPPPLPGSPAPLAPNPSAFEPIGPPPGPPALTGDPTKDVQLNIAHQRALNEHGQKLADRETELNTYAAGIRADQGAKELAAQKLAADRQEKAAQAAAARQAAAQHAIDTSVQERMQAAKEVEGFKWDQPLTGAKLIGAIMGAVGAALQNTAAAQVGQVGHAQNEPLNTINALMQKDYEARKARLASASAAVLEARYGFKDVQENNRAAMNDLDADLAAKYRMIGKEAEAQLLKAGVPAAQVKGNQLVLDAAQKAAQAEAGIQEREETTAVTREGHAATNALASAHLNLAERTAAATEALGRGNLAERRDEHRSSLDERRWEHERALADKADKAAEKKTAAGEKTAAEIKARTLRDPDTGEDIRIMPTARGVQTAADKLVASKAYSQSLRDLADDIETKGRVGSDLPIIGTEAGKERLRLHSEALARGRQALGLGVSNANLQLEHGALGGSGAGLSKMGSPVQLRAMADEQDRIAMQRIRSAGQAVPGAAPAAAGKPPQALIDQAYKALDDPKAPPAAKQNAVKVLTDAGVI